MMHRLNSQSSEEDDSSQAKWKIPYLAIISTGIMQFLLSIPILCYGVFLMQFISENFYDLETGLWAAVLFVSSFKTACPWVRSYCKRLENARCKTYKRNITIAALLLFGEFGLVSFVSQPILHILLYGMCGGILSAVIQVHVTFSTSECFKGRPRLFDTMEQIIRPFCLIFMPHVLLLLIEECGMMGTQLVTGGLLLIIIPACWTIKTTQYRKMPLNKFQTIEKLSVEMSDLNLKTAVSESSSSEDENEEGEEYGCNSPVFVESASNVQQYYQNSGVKILPDIPEESEPEEDDDINEISSKRVRRISDILQELNENTHRTGHDSVNNLFQPEEPDKESDFADYENNAHLKKSRCFSVSSSTRFRLELKKQKIKDFVVEHFVKVVTRTIRTVQFYPAVLSSSITTFTGVAVFTTTPHMTPVKDQNTHESTLYLSGMGFAGIFFMAGYPGFSKFSARKNRLLFLVGLSMLGFSLFVQQFSDDNITLFSLCFGFGHAIVYYSENVVYEDFLGMEKWRELQGALEICSCLIVILGYLIIYYYNLKIEALFKHAYWTYVFDVSLWIVCYVVEQVVIYFRRVRKYNLDLDSDYKS